jgi:hypothetical protein
MNRHFANRFLTLLGISFLVAACSTEDNIADLTDGGGGTGGAAGTGGSAGATGGSGGSSDAGPCESSCPEVDATLCMGNRIVTCAPSSYTGCLAWIAGDYCPTGQGCNADGTQCVTPQVTCTTEGDCGCGCSCVANECKCTGAIPPSCATDDDCGPTCLGLACVEGSCQQRLNPDCVDPCPSVGTQRCVGNAVQQCEDVGGGCKQWSAATSCPQDQVCNNTGTQCITQGVQCTTNDDCGCGCGCVGNECKCAGGLPPSCTTNDECGPACSGFVCIENECVQSSATCIDPCTSAGETRCVGAEIETCVDDGSDCLHWGPKTLCPADQSCNSDGTKCVAAQSTCTDSEDCGCGCGCVANECKCTGAIPPSCTTNDECGPACAGFSCIAGQCVQL